MVVGDVHRAGFGPAQELLDCADTWATDKVDANSKRPNMAATRLMNTFDFFGLLGPLLLLDVCV